ncbi:MAG: bifunctional phosphopantothenoylcysteine decarboxylase/phosphopantothenate synthase [Candidatus Yanofskybacteria bacterium]|nr:bifunctional phosphopantothenoylcysteine decarboxylase/phosphopantothenate synthase [Candidatus Yanofskybacteria bacterium]
MKSVLVSAGSTASPIDQVREISNIFRGRTGAAIAEYFISKSVDCTLVTSARATDYFKRRLRIVIFRTFDELKDIMEREIRNGCYDTIIHSAAVSDYGVSRVLDQDFNPVDSSAKVSSSHPRLYLELEPTVKIVDQIRETWKFNGKLVKFKLQVGISDIELVDIAIKSMAASKADFIVANCLEWCRERAYIIGADGSLANVSRNDLPLELFRRLQ